MTYCDQLRPWAIFRCLPTGQNVFVVRLKTQTDADAYASLLRQGGGTFRVAFDLVTQP